VKSTSLTEIITVEDAENDLKKFPEDYLRRGTPVEKYGIDSDHD
jgi:hypothetical protein